MAEERRKPRTEPAEDASPEKIGGYFRSWMSTLNAQRANPPGGN